MSIDESRRDALLVAAAEILQEEGVDAVSTRAVAARAGVSTQGVYTTFGSRGGLMSALRARLAREFDDHARSETDPERAIERWWDVGLARPEAAALVYAISVGDPAPLPEVIARHAHLSDDERATLWSTLRGALVIALEGGWRRASDGEDAWRSIWRLLVGRA